MDNDLGRAKLMAEEKINSQLLESEKRLAAEKERIRREEAESEERNSRKMYIERLATARNNLIAERATRNELARLQKTANAEYLAELKEAADREREIVKQLKADVSAMYDDILDFAGEHIGEADKKRAAMEKKLSDYGNLTHRVIFHNVDESGKKLIYYNLDELDKTTDALIGYADAIEGIRGKMTEGGFSAEEIGAFVDEIAGLSVEDGTVFTENVQKLSGEEFNKYISSWVNKEKAAQKLAASIYNPQMQTAVDESIRYMTERLESMGLSVPEGFFLSGSISAQRFGDGFVSELGAELAEIQTIIDGFNASLGIELQNAEKSVYSTSVYSPTYQINSAAGGTQLLSEIKAMETRKRLSGVV